MTKFRMGEYRKIITLCSSIAIYTLNVTGLSLKNFIHFVISLLEEEQKFQEKPYYVYEPSW